METTNLLSLVRHWWWTLLAAAVVAGLTAYAFTAALPVDYESRVRLLVGPVSGDHDSLRAAEQLTRTYGELVTSEAVLQGTVGELDLPYEPAELLPAVRPTVDSETRVVIVRVRDSSPDRSAAIADEIAAQLQQYTAASVPPQASAIRDLGVATAEVGRIEVLDAAAPGVPVGAPASLYAGLAAFAGLVGALTLVLLLENLTQTVRTEDELVQLAGVGNLGSVTAPSGPLRPGQGFVVETMPESVRAGEYRILATKVEMVAARDGLRSLLVLAVGDTRGGGELAANLAKVLSERRRCVTLVDANPTDAEITTVLGLRDRPGLTDLLDSADRSQMAVVHPGAFTLSRDPRLFVMPFGRAARRRQAQVTAPPWLVERLLAQADVLVVNAGSVARSAASLIWAGAVDATIVLVPRNRAKRSEISHLFDSLRLVGANPIGVVLEERRRFVRTGGLAIGRDRPRSTWVPATNGPFEPSTDDVEPVSGTNGRSPAPRVGRVPAPPEDGR